VISGWIRCSRRSVSANKGRVSARSVLIAQAASWLLMSSDWETSARASRARTNSLDVRSPA
jgi:hypothetical protein